MPDSDAPTPTLPPVDKSHPGETGSAGPKPPEATETGVPTDGES